MSASLCQRLLVFRIVLVDLRAKLVETFNLEGNLTAGNLRCKRYPEQAITASLAHTNFDTGAVQMQYRAALEFGDAVRDKVNSVLSDIPSAPMPAECFKVRREESGKNVQVSFELRWPAPPSREAEKTIVCKLARVCGTAAPPRLDPNAGVWVSAMSQVNPAVMKGMFGKHVRQFLLGLKHDLLPKVT